MAVRKLSSMKRLLRITRALPPPHSPSPSPSLSSYFQPNYNLGRDRRERRRTMHGGGQRGQAFPQGGIEAASSCSLS